MPSTAFALIKEHLIKSFPVFEDYHRALKEFTHFRMRTGGPDGLFSEESIVFDDSFKTQVAWQCMIAQGSILAPLAVRILSTMANYVASERSFPATNFIHTKSRNRLTTDRANMQTFVFMNERVLERLADPSMVRKRRWEDLEEKDWLDLEDSYVELFSKQADSYMHAGPELVADP